VASASRNAAQEVALCCVDNGAGALYRISLRGDSLQIVREQALGFRAERDGQPRDCKLKAEPLDEAQEHRRCIFRGH
jgi:hypothetical protein